MSYNEQPLSDLEIEDNYGDLSGSPFFTDIDLSTPVNPICFAIQRPHRPPMDPRYAKETVAYLKKLISLSKPVQAI